MKFPYNFRSAFFWFAQDERPKVRAANPNYAVGDIAKELGRRWADSQPNIKSIYEGCFSFLPNCFKYFCLLKHLKIVLKQHRIQNSGFKNFHGDSE